MAPSDIPPIAASPAAKRLSPGRVSARPVRIENPHSRLPSRREDAVFRVKASLLRLRRFLQDTVHGIPRHAPQTASSSEYSYLLAEVRSPLWTDETVAERRLQLGKVQNLRVAIRALQGVEVPGGTILSFWKQIGLPSQARGFVIGRELREGCLIPSPGGGLCQLSNALYEVALKAGLEIVERHPHTQRVPGSSAILGRDATVFWNYIDLRLRSPYPFRIEVKLTGDDLVVRLWGTAPRNTQPGPIFRSIKPLPLLDSDKHGCLSCGQTGCFRHDAPVTTTARRTDERTAFLVDELWPEFAAYLSEVRTEQDILAVPMEGERWRMPRYAWNTEGYVRVHTAPVETVLRAFRLRSASRYAPPLLRAAQLSAMESLAKRFASALTEEVVHVCLALPLLPYLWRDGHLGGRTFDVLMTRFPFSEIHTRLDEAVSRYPERALLGDFRASAELVALESEALAAARQIITPHTEIASLFAERAVLLPWQLPQASAVPWHVGRTIAFPGPTAARKGAYEVREVARQLGLEVILLGKNLEGDSFWEGVRVEQRDRNSSWWQGVSAVVQPSLMEDQPRVLLTALTMGVPVIATPGCGLPKQENLTVIPSLDAEALCHALKNLAPSATEL